MSVTTPRFSHIPPGSLVLLCTVLLVLLSLGSARENSSYAESLVYQPPGSNTTAVTGGINEVTLGEEIVLSFLKRFIGPEKLKKSHQKSSFFENFRRLVKSVEDLVNHAEPKTYSVVTEIPISSKPQVKPEMEETGRGKMTDMMFSPYMLIPQLIVLGFSPIVLANLKMFVMQTFMMNQMAFSAALWMTIRNMVFGPTPEAPVKYYNFGYEEPPPHIIQKRASKRRRTVK